jgi:hypothetical protein
MEYDDDNMRNFMVRNFFLCTPNLRISQMRMFTMRNIYLRTGKLRMFYFFKYCFRRYAYFKGRLPKGADTLDENSVRWEEKEKTRKAGLFNAWSPFFGRGDILGKEP